MGMLDIIFYVLAGLFGLLAAFFKMLSELHSKKERNDTKKRFADAWKLIETSGITQLSEIIIEKFVRIYWSVLFLFSDMLDSMRNRYIRLQLFLFLIGNICLLGLALPISFTLVMIITFSLLAIILLIYWLCSKREINSSYYFKKNMLFIAILILALFGIGMYVKHFLSASNISLFLSSVPVSLLIIYYLVWAISCVSMVFSRRALRYGGWDLKIPLLAVSLGLGFLLTSFSLMLGHFIVPADEVPKAIQLYVSNIFFDAMTIMVTFRMSLSIYNERNKFSIPGTIAILFVMALIFAFLSLYLGLIFTNSKLTMFEVFYALIGHSRDGKNWDLGPYFWVMHTTFIPIFIYLFTVSMAVVAKYLTLPLMAFLKKGKQHEKPYDLTAYTLTFFGVVFGILAKVLDYYIKP